MCRVATLEKTRLWRRKGLKSSLGHVGLEVPLSLQVGKPEERPVIEISVRLTVTSITAEAIGILSLKIRE
jgi:hypothetical protein